MDCVTGDFGCYFEFVRVKASEVAPFIRWLAASITDLFNAVIEALKPHLSSLITLGSLSFAIYKWLRYRDSVLFLRLRDLVAKTIRGLRVARSDLLALVCRPAPGAERICAAVRRRRFAPSDRATLLVARPSSE
jgi:hypothetical protein